MAEKKKVLLRLSPELWEELNRWAADELRSANSQIEYLLREAVRTRRRVLTAAGEAPAETPADDGSDAPREGRPRVD